MALAVIGLGTYTRSAFIHVPEIASAFSDTSDDYVQRIDILDRAGHSSHGSGPVYIGHARCDGLVITEGAVLRNSSFSGGGMLYPSDAVLFSRKQTFTRVPSYHASIKYYSVATYEDDDYLYVYNVWDNNYDHYYRYTSYLSVYRCSKRYRVDVDERGDSLRFQPMWEQCNNIWYYKYPETLDELYRSICNTVSKPVWESRYDRYKTQYVYYVDGGCEKKQADLRFQTDMRAYWDGRAYGLPNTACGSMSNSGPAAAYYAAFEKLPRIESNGIATILDTLKAILSFREGYTGVGSLRDAWLSYRYSYSTTIADIKSFSSVAERWSEISQHPTVQSHAAVTKGKFTYKCTITCDLSKLFSSDLSAKIEKYNVLPTFTNIWDMIPYSFVADWFTDIGEICSSIDTWLAEESYPITSVWYSISYKGVHNDISTSEYCRWQGNIPALPSICYGTSGYVASTKTKAKRFVDAICLAPFERR